MLADATGQHVTRISRIENGIQPPTDRNIQDWCTACGAAGQIPDLVATARVAESAYLDWARQSRAGLKHLGTLAAAPLAAQPFPVQQMSAGKIHAEAGPAQGG